MKNSFERPIPQEEGDRLFKEMRERLANPDFIPEKINAIEIRAITEKPRPKTVKKTKSSQVPASPAKESSASKGWLNDWQDRQEAEVERRLGTDSGAIVANFKEQERRADEERAKNNSFEQKQGNN